MTRKKRRLVLIGSALTVLAVAVALVLTALKDAIVFFNSPTDVAEKHIATGSRLRLGGLVKEGSVQRGDNLQVRFEVTDGKNTIPVTFQGLLPDLFINDGRVTTLHVYPVTVGVSARVIGGWSAPSPAHPSCRLAPQPTSGRRC